MKTSITRHIRHFLARSPDWLFNLLLGVATVVLTQITGVWGVGCLGGVGYMVTGVTGGVALFCATGFSRVHTGALFCLGLGCLAAGFVSGFAMRYQIAADSGLRLHEARASDLVHHPKVAIITFADAVVRTDLVSWYTYSTRSPKGETRSYSVQVAPLVDSDWRPDQLVPAWVVSGSPTARQAWAQPLNRASVYTLMENQQSAMRRAVASVAAKQGLRTTDLAPILTWGGDPAAQARLWWRGSAGIIVLFGLPWLWCTLADLVRWLWHLRKSQRARKPTSVG